MTPIKLSRHKAMLKKYPNITEVELNEWENLLSKSFANGGILNDIDLKRYLDLADKMRIKYV
jgi:hypothetical protein